MKKVVTKITALALAFSLVFSVFALTGCGNKIDKFVGTWESEYLKMTISEDGTVSVFDRGEYKVKHYSDGEDDRGHYEKIMADIALFMYDNEPDRLYVWDTIGGCISTDTYYTRVK